MFTNENELGIDFDIQSDIDIEKIPITPRVSELPQASNPKKKKMQVVEDEECGPSAISQEYIFNSDIYFPNNSGEIDECYTSLINDYCILEEEEQACKNTKQRRKMRAMMQDMEIFQAQQPTYDWNQLAANYLASLDADLYILCCHLLVKMCKNLVNPLSAPHMRDVIEDSITTSCSYFHSIGVLMLSKLTQEWSQEVISQKLDGAGNNYIYFNDIIIFQNLT